ncbi:hypothetical protein [Marinimicrobium sp. ABcell2]|uniref:hypothetical protein n=1 Tax=Marinimicrobium sp. ABcell2 TaxID=3069751 RepID=UPI0027B7171E|nr:hypothetical protein [Marinimicrobium sp. ABcell2]MDQ2076711.1 hypothetical protein [Marinimicrobium sp. ABcell2]
MNNFHLAMVLSVALVAANGAWASDQVYYRYTNERGVTVINDRIPPEYVSKGYEVVTISGTVVRTVEPTPSREERERRAEERRLAEEQEQYDAELRRRYSTVDDIRSAKNRRLTTLQSNIDILEGNVSGVRTRTRTLEMRAASMERSGREVSESVLENLATLTREEEELLDQIEQRKVEYRETEASFERDIARFKELQSQRN